MIPRNVLKREHFEAAAKKLLASGVNNATMYQAMLTIDGVEHGFAPKKLVSIAFEVATGEAWPVSKFSGGDETNRFLAKFNIETKKKEGKF